MPRNPTLLIRITRGRDGPNVLSCARPDGSTTWAKLSDYFPTHDITHFVVESTLGISDGFYGLILDGWDVSDFAVKGAAERLPDDANLVEALVGRLQRDLMPGSNFNADSYNEEVEAVLEGIGNPLRRTVNPEELSVMRAVLRGLLAEWNALAPGQSLELRFVRPGVTRQ